VDIKPSVSSSSALAPLGWLDGLFAMERVVVRRIQPMLLHGMHGPFLPFSTDLTYEVMDKTKGYQQCERQHVQHVVEAWISNVSTLNASHPTYLHTLRTLGKGDPSKGSMVLVSMRRVMRIADSFHNMFAVSEFTSGDVPSVMPVNRELTVDVGIEPLGDIMIHQLMVVARRSASLKMTVIIRTEKGTTQNSLSSLGVSKAIIACASRQLQPLTLEFRLNNTR